MKKLIIAITMTALAVSGYSMGKKPTSDAACGKDKACAVKEACCTKDGSCKTGSDCKADAACAKEKAAEAVKDATSQTGCSGGSCPLPK
jgi:hypothetical protein